MEELDQTMVQQLVDESPRFRLLYEEHLLLEKELRNFDSRPYLSPDDEIERKKVQKMKLAGKDEMIRILRSKNTSQ
ncbi:MAG: DUF465 domain-containing protein [Desulfuromonadales bacterium]|nr:DUF465 domain-containing protein [Desulfuromonadales bacterium]